MSILNVNKINPVGGGSTITIAGIASVTNAVSVGNSVTATSFHGDGSQLTGISVDSTKIETGNTKVETIDTGSDGHVKVTTEGGERLRITSSGSVGVNNTSPSQAKLVVQSGSGTQIAAIKDNTGASISLGGVSQPRVLLEAATSASDFIVYTAGGSSYGSPSWSEKLRITSQGYVKKPSQPMVGCRGFSQNGSTVFNDSNDIVALRFHHIDVNVGSHFNNTTGIFTCPVAGNYFISCQNNRRATDNAWSSLYIIYKPSGGSAQKLSDNWMPSSLNNSWAPIAASHLRSCNSGDELSMAYSSAYSAPSNSSTSGGVQMSIFLFG